MLRIPRSLKVHAIVDPTGDATRFSGDGKLRICSTVNGRDVVCCAINMKANAKIRRRCIVISVSHRGSVPPSDIKYSPPREGESRRGRQGVGHTPSAARAYSFDCAGFNVSFWTRQFVISPTYNSFSLRQSIW